MDLTSLPLPATLMPIILVLAILYGFMYWRERRLALLLMFMGILVYGIGLVLPDLLGVRAKLQDVPVTVILTCYFLKFGGLVLIQSGLLLWLRSAAARLPLVALIFFLVPCLVSLWGLATDNLLLMALPTAVAQGLLLLQTAVTMIRHGAQSGPFRWLTIASLAIWAPASTLQRLFPALTPVLDLVNVTVALLVGAGFIIMFMEDKWEQATHEHRLVERIAEVSPVAITLYDRNGALQFSNPQARLLGDKLIPETVLERGPVAGWYPGDLGRAPVDPGDLPLARVMKTGKVVSGTHLATPGRDGKTLHLMVHAAPILDHAGKVTHVVIISEDISAKVERDAELQHLLEQKEELFREVHHRVRNNLMVILSLLDLHRRGSTGQARRDLDSLERQVQAISLIHQLLHQSRDLDSLGINEYLGHLVTYLESAGKGRLRIHLSPLEHEMYLVVNQLKDLGLIVNELVGSILEAGTPAQAAAAVPGPQAAVHDAVPDRPPVLVELRLTMNGDRLVMRCQDRGPSLEERIQGKINVQGGRGLVDILCQGLKAEVMRSAARENQFILSFLPVQTTQAPETVPGSTVGAVLSERKLDEA